MMIRFQIMISLDFKIQHIYFNLKMTFKMILIFKILIKLNKNFKNKSLILKMTKIELKKMNQNIKKLMNKLLKLFI